MISLDYTRRKLVKSLYIYIAEAEGSGFGIYTARPLVAGSSIVVDEDGDYYANMLTAAMAESLGLDLSRHCFQIDHDSYLLPHGSIDDLINHSCDPNAGIRLNGHGYKLIALRDIIAGEQITYDYSTYISNPRERMRCACGTPLCRGEIGPFHELPQQRQRYYLRQDVVGAFVTAEESVPCL